MAGWLDLPPELLLKVAHASDGGRGMNGVSNSWKQGLESTCTKIILNGPALPQNLATRCPSLTALDLRSCSCVSALALQHLEPLHLNSLILKLDQNEFSTGSIGVLQALKARGSQTHLILSMDPDFLVQSITNPVTLATLKSLELSALELPGLSFSCPFYLPRPVFYNGVQVFLRGLPLIKLDFRSVARDVDLVALKGLPLTELSLKNSHVTDTGLEHLRGLPLTDLNLRDCCSVTDEGLVALRGLGLPLTALDISDCFEWVDFFNGAKGLEGLRGMPLKVLKLEGLPQNEYNFEEFEALQGMELESLSLARCSDVVLDGSLEVLKNMPLTSLNLADCYRVTDIGLQFLWGRPLTSLVLSCGVRYVGEKTERGGEVGDQGLEVLQGMKMTCLDLANSRRITGVGLQVLRGMPLVDLCLDDCDNIDGPSLDVLRGMPLKRLSLAQCGPIIDRDLQKFLGGMPMADFSIGPSKHVTDYGLASNLGGAPLTKLSIRGCAGVKSLRRFKGLPLTKLEARDCVNLPVQAVNEFWESRVKNETQRYKDLLKMFEDRVKQMYNLGGVPIHSDFNSLHLRENIELSDSDDDPDNPYCHMF